MPLLNKTERYVLEKQGGYSRQLIDYWDRQGYIPSRHLLRVRDLIGRSIESLLGQDAAEEEKK